MRILVCGGRDYKNESRVNEVLREYLDIKDLVICQGEARGADRLAKEWAKTYGVECIGYPANWNRDSKAAGPIRNRQMLNEFKPNLVIAFPGGNGTKDMVTISKQANVKVIQVED